MEILERTAERLIRGDRDGVVSGIREAMAAGHPPRSVLEEGLIAGMTVVGARFRHREIFLPEVLLAARAMTAGVDELRPLLVRDGVPSRGTVVLGTVRGDLHDIGKNLVGIMLRGAGFEVVDLGTDVAPERFLEAARESGARVVGLSALLTTTMAGMREVVSKAREADLPVPLRILVGGAPVTEEFAHEIGADAYGPDASSAVECVEALLA
jgi:5-methyltetrahydrofolate--homocysteine methyltransferase